MVLLPTPTQEIKHPLLTEKQVRLFMKRDDLIHPEIMGNKWRKLKYNLQALERSGKEGIVTMGGAYSNHIAAVAAASAIYRFKSLGIVRGEELTPHSNITLQRATENGMALSFVNRETYRDYRSSDKKVAKDYPNWYFLPEGGTNDLAIRGTSEIVSEIAEAFDVMVSPIGTGGTFAGILQSLAHYPERTVIGMSSLKGSFIHGEVENLLRKMNIGNKNYEIVDRYHFGGYGKTTSVLIEFINWFKEYFGIALDPIYTGKATFGVWDMIKSDNFDRNTKIVMLHTGGLQGIDGFNRKNADIIQ